MSTTLSIAREMGHALEKLAFTTPSHVYNPLTYAWDGHATYLDRYGNKSGRVLLMGMNPGPWGMAQTGVPFGNISAVKGWFDIQTKLTGTLPDQHPKYPILGMHCHRDEGSGQRLWGWAEKRFNKPEFFFERFFIWNYCPLLFIANNRNMIPSKLKAREQQALEKVCDAALKKVIETLQPTALVGIGRYAEKRLQQVTNDETPVTYLLHPSPANPAANRHWQERAEQTLAPWLR